MGYALTPMFYKAVECVFHSNNPLLLDDEIVLDQYYVTIQDKDKDGNIVGEREIPCVTHESLMRYYRENLMPRGMRISYDVCSTDPMVCKCIIEKRLSSRDKNRLLKAFPDASADDLDYMIHIEAIGEANLKNAKSEIAQQHLANTAENRAFDRCMIKFLCIDSKETVYGSSEEIGECDDNAKKVSDKKDWLECAIEQETAIQTKMQIPDAPVKESTDTGKAEEKPVSQASSPVDTRANAATTTHINKFNAPALGQYDEKNPVHTIIAAINCVGRVADYDKAFTILYDGSGLYNGKTYGQIAAALIETGDANAASILYSIVTAPPAGEKAAQEFVNLVQLLIDKGRLKFEDKKIVVR